jgi:hypothetical protein
MAHYERVQMQPGHHKSGQHRYADPRPSGRSGFIAEYRGSSRPNSLPKLPRLKERPLQSILHYHVQRPRLYAEWAAQRYLASPGSVGVFAGMIFGNY